MGPIPGEPASPPTTSVPSDRAFTLRAAEPADIDALTALEAACFAQERFHRRQLRYLLSRPTVKAWVVERGHRIVAYLMMLLRVNTSNARFYTLAVSPEWRGHGLARRLMRQAEQTAREAGRTRLSLEIRQGNQAARALYEAEGFHVRTLLPDYYPDGEAGLRMVKELAA